MTTQRYRKKPVVVEAVEWDGYNYREIKAFCPTAVNSGDNEHLTVPTLEGDHTANKGDFIVKGVNGEFYPVKPDIFAKTYEVA